MIKHFCDQCGVQITELNKPRNDFSLFLEGGVRLGGAYKELGFSITTGHVSTKTWNGGDFCKYCIIDAVNTLDDRPKAP